MGDPFNKFLKWTDHNRYKALAALVVCVSVGWLVGCKSATASLVTGEPVERPAFEAEVASLKGDLSKELAILTARANAIEAKVAVGEADLAEQEAAKQAAFDAISAVAVSAVEGGLTPLAAVNGAITLIGLLGLGTLADNRRKDKKITELKSE